MGVCCTACGSAVSGRYMRQEEAAFCLSCFESLPRCTRCNAVFVEGQRWLERPFCARCVQQAERCVLCSDICVGQFWQYEKLGVVCGRCNEQAPRCQRCRTPTRDGRRSHPERPEEVLCVGCWQEVERCHGCAVPIIGRYYSHAAAPERKFCPACHEHKDRCDFCGLPATGEVARYSDGRISCGTCRATAVMDAGRLGEIEEAAREWLAGQLSLLPRQGCPVQLVDAAQIAQLQDKAFHATPGFDVRERGLFSASVRERLRGDRVVDRQETLHIYIESELPAHDAFGTTVHELIHLWQFDHFPKSGVDRRYIEGLACWAQYHALKELGAAAAAERVATNPDPIYGDGYRLVSQLEQRVGKARTIDALLEQLR